MKKILVIIILHSVFSIVRSQTPDSLSLKWAYKLAVDNYPLAKQREILPEASKLKTENIKSAYLPQFSLNAQATYQSQVTEIPISIPNLNIPSLYKDMYKATVDVNQLIFDAGAVRLQKNVEQQVLLADRQNLEVQLFQLKQRVNQLFFAVLLSQKNRKVIELQKDDISKNLEKINSAVKFGTSIKANADILSAEIIRIDIQLIDIDEAVNSALKMLSELIGRNVTPLTALIFPEISDGMINSENKRPEMSFYDLQQSVLEANGSLVATQRYPRVFGFGEAGYGRPGLNMLSNRFDSFWLIGGKITWNIWVWNQTSKQRKIIDLQKNIINTQKETFDKNLKISQNTYIADISRYSEMIKKDAEVIKLREEILKAGSSQLLNGIISSTDFVIQENDLAMAKINLENHKLQLAYAKINYLTNLGQ